MKYSEELRDWHKMRGVAKSSVEQESALLGGSKRRQRAQENVKK
jgi:hypothetical protein